MIYNRDKEIVLAKVNSNVFQHELMTKVNVSFEVTGMTVDMWRGIHKAKLVWENASEREACNDDLTGVLETQVASHVTQDMWDTVVVSGDWSINGSFDSKSRKGKASPVWNNKLAHCVVSKVDDSGVIGITKFEEKYGVKPEEKRARCFISQGAAGVDTLKATFSKCLEAKAKEEAKEEAKEKAKEEEAKEKAKEEKAKEEK